MEKTAIALVLATLLALPIKVDAQFFGFPSQETTQLLNHAQLMANYVKQAETALRAVQMAQIMVHEGVDLATHPTTSIQSDLWMLDTIMQQSRGLAGNMAQMDASFRATYTPYNPSPTATYAQAYANWAQTALDSIHGAVNAAGFQSNMLNSEQAFMSKIQTMMQSPAGRNQALQLGNVIGTEEIAQLQKLRALMISDMSSKAAFTATQVNRQQAQEQASKSGFTYVPPAVDSRAW